MNSRRFCASLSCYLLLAGWIVAAADEPAEATVMHPLVKELTDYEHFTGRTDPSSRVDLRARVTGYLVKVNFQDGAEVKKGDLLFEIDPRPYQAQFDQAKA